MCHWKRVPLGLGMDRGMFVFDGPFHVDSDNNNFAQIEFIKINRIILLKI